MPRMLTDDVAAEIICPERINLAITKAETNELRWLTSHNETLKCSGPHCMLWRHEITLDTLGKQTGIGGRGYCSKFGRDD